MVRGTWVTVCFLESHRLQPGNLPRHPYPRDRHRPVQHRCLARLLTWRPDLKRFHLFSLCRYQGAFITKLTETNLSFKSHWHQSSGTHCSCPHASCRHNWSSCSRVRRRMRDRWGLWCGLCRPTQQCRSDRCHSSVAFEIQQTSGEGSPSHFEDLPGQPVWHQWRRSGAHGCLDAETRHINIHLNVFGINW